MLKNSKQNKQNRIRINSHDGYALGQIFDLQKRDKIDHRANISVENIGSMLPGCKDWIDIEKKLKQGER